LSRGVARTKPRAPEVPRGEAPVNPPPAPATDLGARLQVALGDAYRVERELDQRFKKLVDQSP